METTLTAPVSFTEGAIAEIKRLMAEEGFDKSTLLRVGVKGGFTFSNPNASKSCGCGSSFAV